ncbi:MAG TPA: hypothetical protein VIG66_00715, partial [Noviherbaspirillum sp.]
DMPGFGGVTYSDTAPAVLKRMQGDPPPGALTPQHPKAATHGGTISPDLLRLHQSWDNHLSAFPRALTQVLKAFLPPGQISNDVVERFASALSRGDEEAVLKLLRPRGATPVDLQPQFVKRLHTEDRSGAVLADMLDYPGAYPGLTTALLWSPGAVGGARSFLLMRKRADTGQWDVISGDESSRQEHRSPLNGLNVLAAMGLPKDARPPLSLIVGEYVKQGVEPEPSAEEPSAKRRKTGQHPPSPQVSGPDRETQAVPAPPPLQAAPLPKEVRTRIDKARVKAKAAKAKLEKLTRENANLLSVEGVAVYKKKRRDSGGWRAVLKMCGAKETGCFTDDIYGEQAAFWLATMHRLMLEDAMYTARADALEGNWSKDRTKEEIEAAVKKKIEKAAEAVKEKMKPYQNEARATHLLELVKEPKQWLETWKETKKLPESREGISDKKLRSDTVSKILVASFQLENIRGEFSCAESPVGKKAAHQLAMLARLKFEVAMQTACAEALDAGCDPQDAIEAAKNEVVDEMNRLKEQARSAWEQEKASGNAGAGE